VSGRLSLLCPSLTFVSLRYVLPNHSLFQLAEQPPADMVALLRVFQSVPPVIRRRAKELLDTIRNCVRDHLSSKTSPSPDVQEDIEMQDEVQLPTSTSKDEEESGQRDNSTLWSSGQSVFS
jgi:exosome complex exonuclease RRP6